MNRVAKVLLLSFLVISLVRSPAFGSDAKSKADEDDKEGSFSIEGIEVIQNRLFQKRGRHELTAAFGVLYDNNFVFYEVFPIRYTYHLRESIAFEGTAAFAFGQEKALVSSLREQYTLNVSVEKIKQYYTGNFLWSPIYGKFNIFASYILHFDFFITTGCGMMRVKVTEGGTSGSHFTFNVGAGIKVYMNDWFVIRVDFRNFTWKEGAPFNDLVNNRILSLGASFFFPFHKK